MFPLWQRRYVYHNLFNTRKKKLNLFLLGHWARDCVEGGRDREGGGGGGGRGGARGGRGGGGYGRDRSPRREGGRGYDRDNRRYSFLSQSSVLCFPATCC